MKRRLFALLVAMLMLVSVFALTSCDIASLLGIASEENCDDGHVDADGDEICDRCEAAVPAQPGSDGTEIPADGPMVTISFYYHGVIYGETGDRDDFNRPLRAGAEGEVEIGTVKVLQDQVPTQAQLDKIAKVAYGSVSVIGWYDSPALENEVDFNKVITSDMKVYAKLRIDEPDKKGNQYCGDKAYWEVTSKGVLKITGEGAMYDYAYPELAPWYFEDDGVTRRIITGIKVSDKITHIGDYSFYEIGIAKETDVDLGEGVTSIGNYAFAYSIYLKVAPLTAGVTDIGRSAFEGCMSFTGMIMPESVKNIGEAAFKNCTRLANIVIGVSVKKIGTSAFENCKSLVSINYRGTESQWKIISKGSSWDNGTGNYTVNYKYNG